MRPVVPAVLMLCLLLLLPLPPCSAKRRAKGSAKERRKERKAAERAKFTQEELWAQEDEAMPAYNSALDAEDENDFPAAEAAYRDAIAIAPAWVAPAMNHAVLLNRLRRTKEAIAQYEALLDIHRGHTQAIFNLANAHRSIDELDKAKALYRKVIVQSWTEAGSEEGKERETNMLPAAATNLGNVLQTQGHYEEAVAQHRQAFNLSPETVDAAFNLGVSLIGMGGMGLEEAPTLWNAAVQHNPHFLLRLTNGGGWVPEMLVEEAGAVQAVAEQSANEVGDGEEGKARREKMPMLVKSLRMTESSVRTCTHKQTTTHSLFHGTTGRI
jgi:tetratricopeptide (TPR) repeat protein